MKIYTNGKESWIRSSHIINCIKILKQEPLYDRGVTVYLAMASLYTVCSVLNISGNIDDR